MTEDTFESAEKSGPGSEAFFDALDNEVNGQIIDGNTEVTRSQESKPEQNVQPTNDDGWSYFNYNSTACPGLPEGYTGGQGSIGASIDPDNPPSSWLGTGDPNNPVQSDFDFNTDCSSFNELPQDFQDSICGQCEDPTNINMQCECGLQTAGAPGPGGSEDMSTPSVIPTKPKYPQAPISTKKFKNTMKLKEIKRLIEQAISNLSVKTPGAPQPQNYPGGGTDPKYLRDKAAFIKKMKMKKRKPGMGMKRPGMAARRKPTAARPAMGRRGRPAPRRRGRM